MTGSVTSEFKSRSSDYLASELTLQFLGLVFVVTRLWTRFIKHNTQGWDDYLMVVTMCCSIVSIALTIVMYSYGYGTTIYALDTWQKVGCTKFSGFSAMMNGFSMAFLKCSIGASLLRLQFGRGMTIVVWICITISILCNSVTLIGSLFKCRPIQGIWDKTIEADCLPQIVSMIDAYIQTVGNIVTDLGFSLGPLFYLTKVKVSVYNKWALRGVFLLGLSATVLAIAKCSLLPKLATFTDSTYDGVGISIMALAEFEAGFIAANIPPLKSLFERTLKRVFGVSAGISSTGATPGSYAMHSFKNSRLNRNTRHQPLEDVDADEENARRLGNAAVITASGTKGQSTTKSSAVDVDSSSDEEDQRHILKGHIRSVSRSMGRDEPQEGAVGNDRWITKTIEYSVHGDANTSRDVRQ
ncbi:putative Integral membrane protein [Seiridium unicorne]|uniref:Integral membrane protein n=1 Tax=Seiridium unicorne TaxID=138068 RepID=A0ABR2UVZ5_9PEZI